VPVLACVSVCVCLCACVSVCAWICSRECRVCEPRMLHQDCVCARSSEPKRPETQHPTPGQGAWLQSEVAKGVAEIARDSAVFGCLSGRERDCAFQHVKIRSFSRGTVVMSRGRSSGRVLLVRSGTIEVRVNGSVISTRTRGDVVGEVCAFAAAAQHAPPQGFPSNQRPDASPRSETITSQVCVSDAVAAEAVSAYEVSISNLTPFFKSNPQLVRALEGLSVRTINQAAKAGSRSASILLDEVSGSVINVGSGVCGITVRPWTR